MNRNANYVVHAFAQSSHSYESPHYWIHPPEFVVGLPLFFTTLANIFLVVLLKKKIINFKTILVFVCVREIEGNLSATSK